MSAVYSNRVNMSKSCQYMEVDLPRIHRVGPPCQPGLFL